MKTSTFKTSTFLFILASLLTTGLARGQSYIVIGTNVGEIRTNVTVQMTNSQFARTWNIGTNWTMARVGMRFMFTNGVVVPVVSTPRLALGFCSSTNSFYLSTTTSNFLGIVSTNASWSQVIYAGAARYSGIGMQMALRTNGTTYAFGSVSNTDIFFSTNGANYSPYASMLLLTVTKGSPNYTVSRWTAKYTAGGAQASYCSKDDFDIAMPLLDPAQTGFVAITNTIAYDEATGPLDSITVTWDRYQPILEIFEIAMAKLR